MLAATPLKLSRAEYALCRKASMLRLLHVRDDQPGWRALYGRREAGRAEQMCNMMANVTCGTCDKGKHSWMLHSKHVQISDRHMTQTLT